jgi:hypothetical protein
MPDAGNLFFSQGRKLVGGVWGAVVDEWRSIEFQPSSHPTKKGGSKISPSLTLNKRKRNNKQTLRALIASLRPRQQIGIHFGCTSTGSSSSFPEKDGAKKKRKRKGKNERKGTHSHLFLSPLDAHIVIAVDAELSPQSVLISASTSSASSSLSYYYYYLGLASSLAIYFTSMRSRKLQSRACALSFSEERAPSFTQAPVTCTHDPGALSFNASGCSDVMDSPCSSSFAT